MTKIERNHQRVRTALLRGEALALQDREQVLEAMSLIDTQIESSLLEIESACENLQQEVACMIQPKVLDVLNQHIILSDLIYWLKTQNGGMHG